MSLYREGSNYEPCVVIDKRAGMQRTKSALDSVADVLMEYSSRVGVGGAFRSSPFPCSGLIPHRTTYLHIS